MVSLKVQFGTICSRRAIHTAYLKTSHYIGATKKLLSLAEGMEGYARQQFINDLLDQVHADIRRCFDAGVYNVHIEIEIVW